MVQRIVGLALVAAFALPASASAGQYKVVTCQWPGANGVNNSWTPAFTGFNVPPNPEAYKIVSECGPGQVGLQVQSDNNATARFLTGASYTFTAPSGTRIVRLEVDRSGYARDYSGGDPNKRWSVGGRDITGNPLGGPLGGEYCGAPCDIPGPNRSQQASFDLNAAGVVYDVGCGDTSGCPTNYGIPLAAIGIHGAAVTLDDPSNPTLNAGGALFGDGWVPASAKATVDASDNSGVSSLKLLLDGADAASAPTPCDFTRPVPCGAVKGVTLGLTGEIGDGAHAVSVVVLDAAGNQTRRDKQVQIDGHAPSVAVGLPLRGRFSTAVSDGASGVGRVLISGRDSSGGDLRPLRLSRLRHGRIVGFYNRRLAASRLVLHVEAADKVGNVTIQDGRPVSIRPTRSRVVARFGRAATIRGRLVDAAGHGVAGRTVSSTTTVRETGASTVDGPSSTTGRGGAFRLRLPGGLSRDVRLTFAGGDGALGARRTAVLAVPASTTFSAPPSVHGRGRVTFHGTVNAHGQAIPTGGLTVLLQGRQGRGWRTFKAARTDRRGHWHATYRFSGRPGTFAIRATVRRNQAFPFDTGASETRRVLVR